MEDKEHIYEKEIKPLVDQLVELCDKHDIPFVAACQISETGIIGSYFLPESGTCQQLELVAAIMEHGVPTVLVGLARTQAMEQTPVKVVD